MMEFREGEIILVNFNPQRKKEEIGKIRPAIVVSDTDLNSILDLIVVVPLTTNLIDNALPLRIRISERKNLPKNSDAMIENIRAISKDRVIEKLTFVTKKELETIKNGLKVIFNL